MRDAEALRALGIPEEAITRAMERGDPEGAIFDAVLMPGIAERTVSAAEVEERGGLAVSDLDAFITALGLQPPAHDAPAFTAEEADALVELGRLKELWPPELDVRLGRVWGPLLRRVAQAGIQEFRLNVEHRLRADVPDRLGALRAVQSAFARLLPLTDPLLVGVHRRWVEHELAQAAVRQAESSAGSHPLPGAVSVAFLFCDLKDYTAFADSHGDAAALEAVERLADVVARERGEQFRLMKALGDGFMLAYADAPAAVSAATGIVDRMRGPGELGVHASVHHGVAIARNGDYFGGAVNLAARLLGVAGAGEIVATQPVVERTADAFTWEPAGVHRVRGVADPVEVFRLKPVAAPHVPRPEAGTARRPTRPR